MKRALFSIRNRWIPSPAENNDRAQTSSRCWNDGCTKGSESGGVQGFGARLTKKIGKCVLKCVLAKEKAVDSNESTAFILVEVTGLEPAASWSQTYREHFFRLFIVVFSYFCSVLVTLWHSLKGLFPGVPGLSVVIYVVKNASRPVPGELSPVLDRKRFAFQTVCIVTLSRRLCKLFLSRGRLKG